MIEKILDKNNIAYKVIDGEDNTTIIKINGKLHSDWIVTPFLVQYIKRNC